MVKSKALPVLVKALGVERGLPELDRMRRQWRWQSSCDRAKQKTAGGGMSGESCARPRLETHVCAHHSSCLQITEDDVSSFKYVRKSLDG